MAVVALARPQDILRIVDMVEDLRAAVGGPVPVDRPWTARMLAGMLGDPQAVVFVSAAGFIAGSLQPTVINPALIAMEHGWFATDGTGLRLLRAFEGWAHEQGAMMVRLSTAPSGMDLTRLGYRAAELAWVK
ncbi:hypothetical protein [Paracoccus sp. KR1-242]|uniref:hypothetical protein n=1 Tax=Paracoccus sp. KR1-242 TaxID=3410028 RepID=UPI003C02EA3D